MSEKKKTGPQPIGELLPARAQPSAVRKRLLLDPFLLDPNADGAILYQQSVLCQTCLPYRDPGAATRTWQRKNGLVTLEVQAGRAYNGEDFIDVGLPFGPKPRPCSIT